MPSYRSSIQLYFRHGISLVSNKLSDEKHIHKCSLTSRTTLTSLAEVPTFSIWKLTCSPSVTTYVVRTNEIKACPSHNTIKDESRITVEIANWDIFSLNQYGNDQIAWLLLSLAIWCTHTKEQLRVFFSLFVIINKWNSQKFIQYTMPQSPGNIV